MSKSKITTIEMECALARHFNYRQNLIVPNVSWGIDIHECDLLVVTRAGYATEVEIKVSKTDLKKDAEKPHQHQDYRIKSLYFAIPDYLIDCTDLVPERAGIISVETGPLRVTKQGGKDYVWKRRCEVIRKAVINKRAPKFSDLDKAKITRLGALRI
ncbi:MAG: hypothetical protein AAF578_00215 [Pseudomonadota bacterium]